MLRIAGFAGQLVVSELVYITAFCFSCDLFEHRTRKNLGPEDGRNFFFADLFDQSDYFPGARIGEVGRLHRADDLEAITARKIGPRVVISEQATLARRNGLNRVFNRLIKRFEFFYELRAISFIRVLVFRIEANEFIARQSRVAHRVFGIQPEVRIGMALFFGETEVVDVLVLLDRFVAE